MASAGVLEPLSGARAGAAAGAGGSGGRGEALPLLVEAMRTSLAAWVCNRGREGGCSRVRDRHLPRLVDWPSSVLRRCEMAH